MESHTGTLHTRDSHRGVTIISRSKVSLSDISGIKLDVLISRRYASDSQRDERKSRRGNPLDYNPRKCQVLLNFILLFPLLCTRYVSSGASTSDVDTNLRLAFYSILRPFRWLAKIRGSPRARHDSIAGPMNSPRCPPRARSSGLTCLERKLGRNCERRWKV